MHRLLIIPLLCLLVHCARAAQAATGKGITIRLFAVALNKDQGPLCLMTGDLRGPAFDLPTTSLSAPQTVAGRELVLVAAASATDSLPRPLGAIHLPEQGSDFRILLVPTVDSTYRSVVIRADDPKFGHGDFFFINLSTQPILGLLGTTKLELKPGSQEMVRPAGTKSEKFFEVKFARREADNFVPITDTCWPIVRDNRSFVIFYNGKGDRPTYRAVDEFMPLEAAGG